MNDNAIVPSQPNDLAQNDLTTMELAGQAADKVAARHVFDDYKELKSQSTLDRQKKNLEHFTEYLTEARTPPADDLYTDPDSWKGITAGLIKGFVKWLLNKGYAIGTVNLALSNVRKYAALAHEADVISEAAYSKIRLVKGYTEAEGNHLDMTKRADQPTRIGAKKAGFNTLDRKQIDKLKGKGRDLKTPQERRDSLMMNILIDLGLRVSEVELLTVGQVDLENRVLKNVFHPKLWKTDNAYTNHWLPDDVYDAMKAWFDYSDALPSGEAPLLRASRKNGKLTDGGMSKRAIAGRVRFLGQTLLNIDDLSPHDMRHTGATIHGNNPNITLRQLMDWGNWRTTSIAIGYIKQGEVVNQGMPSV